MYDVILAHKPRLLDIAVRLKRSTHTALGLVVNDAPVAGQRMHGTTFRALKVTFQAATPGAECGLVFSAEVA